MEGRGKEATRGAEGWSRIATPPVAIPFEDRSPGSI